MTGELDWETFGCTGSAFGMTYRCAHHVAMEMPEDGLLSMSQCPVWQEAKVMMPLRTDLYIATSAILDYTPTYLQV